MPHKNYYMPLVSMIDINQSKHLSPSMSLSSLHHASEYHQIKARQNDQLLAALSQAAAAASVGQNTELMNLQNQKQQQLAASALLSLSNSNSDALTVDQNNYNIVTALRQLQQQQNNINMSNMQKGNMNLLDSLAVAAAIVNQNQQLQQTAKNQQYIQTLQALQKSEKFNQSLSYPTLPSHLINNMINTNKQNSDLTQSIEQGLKKPKFGHAVHVEEENEMLLENELKIAAKLNEDSSNEDTNTEMIDEPSSTRLWNEHRESSVSMSISDMRQSNGGFYKKQTNQFYLVSFFTKLSKVVKLKRKLGKLTQN